MMELKAGRRGREGVVLGGFAVGDGRGGGRPAGADVGGGFGAEVVSSCLARASKSASATSPNKSSDDMAPASAHTTHTTGRQTQISWRQSSEITRILR
jgi:hypothetical protein